MQSETLGIRALPGRAGHRHRAELLATSLTMSLAVEQNPVLILYLLGVNRNTASHFSLAWYSILLSIHKFGESDYCLGEEKEKNPNISV